MRRRFACTLPLLLIATAATAPTSPPRAPSATTIVASEALQDRAKDVVALLGGKGDYDALFSPAFREKVPKATFESLAARLSGGGGAVTGVEKLTPDTPYSASL